MIDPENQVFSAVYDALVEAYPALSESISGEYIRTPPSLPHVSITMSDSYAARGEQDTRTHEVETNFMFEVNVYSNKQNGKKSECKAILKVIDEALFKLNMQRISMTPVPNLEDATIYRLVARYTGATDGKYFYRR